MLTKSADLLPAAPSNDVSERLAHRLRAETEGEVLFDAPSRGRYATDASIYQIMPVGVLVPKSERDIATALDIARDLKVPVLPRGGGTSQCGQAIGAALVIDNSKYFRRIRALDVERRTVVVEPGLVLDHLNAELKRHGLWYPVDVSTSAQATLGGMAGNNSCGSRSIAYGNMVHNVQGISAWLSDGALVDFGPVPDLSGRGAEIAGFVQQLAEQHRAEIEARWPKVLRRVAGYNLDIFDNRSERPYTVDNSVNLAHLLVGAEGTLAYTKSLTLKLSELPRAKVLGVVNFPTFRAAMSAAQHIVKLGPTRGRAGRPHHDRPCPRQSGLPADHRDGADRHAGGDPAGRIRRRRQAGAAAAAKRAGRADGRSRAAGQRGARWPTTRRRRTSGRCGRPGSTS